MRKHTLVSEAFTRDGLVDLGTGAVQLIDNQINQATGTLKLKAVYPNPSHHLWPNQFVKARVDVSVRKGALVIPSVAVQRGPDGPFVYKVKSDSTVDVARVVLGPLQAETQVIESGLAVGDEIVIEGQYKLRPGAPVDTKSPRGAADGGVSPGGFGAAK
jgi:multidrug efflux system membrane fusion protein